MGSKGGKNHLKRLATPKKVKILRKNTVWTVRGNPGAHKLTESVPLTTIIRDYLGYAKTAKEAEKIIKEKKVLIDKKPETNPKRTVGFMDLIDIPLTKEQYRVTLDNKGRIILKKIEKPTDFKLVKIKGKKILKKGTTQLNLHDNRNILVKNDTYKVGDVLKIKLPNQEIEKHLKMEKGNIAYITKGKHAGKTGKITNIEKGTLQRKPLVTIKKDEQEFTTRKDNIFIIGEKTSELETIE